MRPVDPVKWLLGRPFDREWRWPGRADPERWERVEFESAGARLAGLYGDVQGQSHGAVLCCHPLDVRAKGYFLGRQADVLRSAGFEVFAFDCNGFGESEHGTARFTRDVEAALACLDRTAESDRYGALGVSFGAGVLLCALARSDHDVRAALFDSAYTTPGDFWEAWDRRQAVVLKAWLAARRRTARALTPIENAPDLDGLAAVRFVVGQRDEYTPPEMSRTLADAVGLPAERVDVWAVPGAGHREARRTDPEGYDRRLRATFEAALAR